MYGSNGLVVSQEKWCTTHKELWAIVYLVATQFALFLQRRDFTLRTDHSSLLSLKCFNDKASDMLAHWLYYLEPFRAHMKIKHQAGNKHGNADALSRFETRSCPRFDCQDPGHKLLKRNLSKATNQTILIPILTCSQISAKDFDSDCAVVHSFKDEELRMLKLDILILVSLIDLFNEHTEKPSAKSLVGESFEVKILCSLWKQFKIVDVILYRVGKTDIQFEKIRLHIPSNLSILARKHILVYTHRHK